MFSSWARKVLAFVRREDGPTAVEYAVMLALIIVVCIASLTKLGSAVNVPFEIISDTIPTPSP